MLRTLLQGWWVGVWGVYRKEGNGVFIARKGIWEYEGNGKREGEGEGIQYINRERENDNIKGTRWGYNI